MEKLKLEKPGEVDWDYDKDADVLYLSFGSPESALTIEKGEGFLARYRESDSELVGFTILDASRLLKKRANTNASG